jgi:hypothetical protein
VNEEKEGWKQIMPNVWVKVDMDNIANKPILLTRLTGTNIILGDILRRLTKEELHAFKNRIEEHLRLVEV